MRFTAARSRDYSPSVSTRWFRFRMRTSRGSALSKLEFFGVIDFFLL